MKTTRRLSTLVVTLAGTAVMLTGCGNGGSDRGALPIGTTLLERALSTEPESLDPQKSRRTYCAISARGW
jgi:ABC-type oligopeptide transport system substrate-binding subunit